jgi:hypothetical protein
MLIARAASLILTGILLNGCATNRHDSCKVNLRPGAAATGEDENGKFEALSKIVAVIAAENRFEEEPSRFPWNSRRYTGGMPRRGFLSLWKEGAVISVSREPQDPYAYVGANDELERGRSRFIRRVQRQLYDRLVETFGRTNVTLQTFRYWDPT